MVMPFLSHRRTFLKTTAAAVAALAVPRVAWAEQDNQEVPVPEIRLVAQEGDIEVAPGRIWRTWTYNGQVPGPRLRVRQGERLRVILKNELTQPTTIHWHGVPVPNNMDGVPELTQDAVMPGEQFVYEYTAEVPGTYFYHSHVGLQLDRALSGSLVIDPAEETLAFDADITLVLDDWLTITPEQAMTAMSQPGRMGGMMGRSSDPPYAGYLINGRITAGAEPLRVARGQRIRLRFINAGGATTFRCGIEGHRLEVTHADGQPVLPVLVDTIVLGVGERYDVIVTADNPGSWPLVAGPVDSVVPGVVAPFVYAGSQGVLTPPVVWPPRLRTGRVLRYADLQALNANATETRTGLARTIPLELAGGMMGSNAWTINGQAYPNASPITVDRGERIRFSMFNRSMVRHPMHLHGHFFRLVNPLTGRATGPVKDTVLVESMMGQAEVEWVADNPGRWFLHCHNAYHMEAGMARVVDVR
ncbi:MAG: multicopper oxidase family protein [Acidobacteriota bacterium]